MTAGLATLGLLDGSAYAALEQVSRSLEEGILRAARSAAVPVRLDRVGSMVGLFFGDERVRNFDDAKRSPHRLYPRFHRSMMERGVYLPPSPFETIFLSCAHTEGDVDKTVAAASKAFRECAKA